MNIIDKGIKVKGILSDNRGKYNDENRIKRFIQKYKILKDEKSKVIENFEEFHIINFRKIKDKLFEMESKKDKYKYYNI